MKKIGLTGGIASGKSSVGLILEKMGVRVISADSVAHKILEPGEAAYHQVVAEFGLGILDGQGRIDRKKLGRLVFGNERLRKRLEELTHPVIIAVIKETIDFYERSGLQLVVIEIPLLFEVGLRELVDEIWVVTVDSREQFRRLMLRDQISEEEAKSRIAAQLPLAEKEKLADVVIQNNQTLEDLEAQVRALIKDYF
ncbi:MAG: dephospho-CoA kinase [Firmicutes bacterium]|nr:dephospho-CoA kinase [Bacillota bacterium]